MYIKRHANRLAIATLSAAATLILLGCSNSGHKNIMSNNNSSGSFQYSQTDPGPCLDDHHGYAYINRINILESKLIIQIIAKIANDGSIDANHLIDCIAPGLTVFIDKDGNLQNVADADRHTHPLAEDNFLLVHMTYIFDFDHKIDVQKFNLQISKECLLDCDVHFCGATSVVGRDFVSTPIR